MPKKNLLTFSTGEPDLPCQPGSVSTEREQMLEKAKEAARCYVANIANDFVHQELPRLAEPFDHRKLYQDTYLPTAVADEVENQFRAQQRKEKEAARNAAREQQAPEVKRRRLE